MLIFLFRQLQLHRERNITNMSEQTNDRPTKKAKEAVSSTAVGDKSSSSSSARDNNLPSLLTQLNGGNTLDLAVMSAIKCSINDDDASGGSKNPTHSEMVQSTISKLFTDHVGKSPEVVVGNARRHVDDDMKREVYIFNKKQDRRYFGDEREKWLNHPQNREIEGPRSYGKVWLELFLGKERAEELLEGTAPFDSKEMEESNSKLKPTEHAVWESFKGEVSQLPTIDMLSNILTYVRNEASKVSMENLLRFSVVYGLDGVMKDILLGRYGAVGDLSINSLLPVDDKPLSETPPHRMIFGGRRKFFYPPYGIGAILGHSNIVVASLKELNGKFDVPFGAQFKHDEEMKEYDDHTGPSGVFMWVLLKNMREVIKCLVGECGFQFRWIDHDSDMTMVFHRIFDAEDWPLPQWAGDVTEEDYMWESSRDRSRMRMASSYKEQMKMLDVLISLGFPFELFFPTVLSNTIERQEKLREEKKLETRQECRDYDKSLTKEERKAMQVLYEACSAFNSLQTTEPATLTLGDYFRKLKTQWAEGQQMAQVSRLDEFEALDSRWRKTQRQQNGEEGIESDDESYGSGSSYEYPGDY